MIRDGEFFVILSKLTSNELIKWLISRKGNLFRRLDGLMDGKDGKDVVETRRSRSKVNPCFQEAKRDFVAEHFRVIINF